jgi:hypothetical protein
MTEAHFEHRRNAPLDEEARQVDSYFTEGSTMIDAVSVIAEQAAFTGGASVQSARDIRGPSPLVAIENEAPAKLIVDPPLPEQLAQGRVFIQYRTENLRVIPVFGKGALGVSPRLGMSTSPSTMRLGILSTPAVRQ